MDRRAAAVKVCYWPTCESQCRRAAAVKVCHWPTCVSQDRRAAAVKVCHWPTSVSQCRCRIPECDGEDDSFLPDWLQDAVPFEDRDSQSRPVRCLRFTPRNISTSLDSRSNDSVCSSEMFDRNNNIRCQEWVYDGEETTIVNEVLQDFSPNVAIGRFAFQFRIFGGFVTFFQSRPRDQITRLSSWLCFQSAEQKSLYQ
jgi:hypothetical protein